MKKTIACSLFILFVFSARAQTKWVRKKLFSGIEIEFPSEPRQMDLGVNTNWMSFYDSTVFQLSKIKQEEKDKTSYRSCNNMLQGILDESQGKVVATDSFLINKYCAISFTVQPGVEELAGMEMKGFVLDMDGKSFILMATSSKKKSPLVDRFIASFKIR
jgi:hypothetical protein